MNRIIDGRGTGKTSRLMLLAKDSGAIIACADPEIMYKKAMMYEIQGLTFISYWDLLGHNYPDGSKILIDELENYVRTILKGSLKGYTLSLD